MENREKIEDKEYKERIKKIVERVEKTKDKDSKYTEQDIIEKLERLLQTITRKTQEGKFRSEKIIVILTYWINGIYKNKKEKDYIPIDTLYELIAEQLKKPNPYFPKFDLNREIADKRRILRKMEIVLGVKKIKQFKKKYNLSKLV